MRALPCSTISPTCVPACLPASPFTATHTDIKASTHTHPPLSSLHVEVRSYQPSCLKTPGSQTAVAEGQAGTRAAGGDPLWDRGLKCKGQNVWLGSAQMHGTVSQSWEVYGVLRYNVIDASKGMWFYNTVAKQMYNMNL